MYQTLIEYSGSHVGGRDARNHSRKRGLAPQWQRLAALVCAIVATGAVAVESNVEISEGRNPLLRTYMARQAEKLASAAAAGNQMAMIEPVSGLPEAPFFTASESTQCREKANRFCRDFAHSEFRVTSLRFMVPEVAGLSPKSLTIRRNSVVANYTFR